MLLIELKIGLSVYLHLIYLPKLEGSTLYFYYSRLFENVFVVRFEDVCEEHERRNCQEESLLFLNVSLECLPHDL